MNLVNLERVVKAYGQRALLQGVSAGVASRDRVGVVGSNGAGKSTLLALLAGREQPDEGRVTRTRGLRIGSLAQQDRLTGTVAELVMGGGPEHTWAGNPKARAVAAALLPGIGFEARADHLSGGEARRVALAALLATDHDLLLLDEPTNQLDIEAVAWLAQFLSGLTTAMVVVTHDRWFLDAVATKTWEVAVGRLHAYDGGYAAYVLARAERARAADATEKRRQNLVRKELAWLRRGPPARTSKPRFRIDAANALIANEPPARDSVALESLATARLGKTVLDAEDLTVTVGDRTLFDGVTWHLGPGERVGLMGPNGSGKTTLLRLLSDTPINSGSLQTKGHIKRGKTVQLGYLTQSDAGLDLTMTPRDVVASVSGNALASEGPGSAGQLLERLGLRGDTQWTPIGDLSGGERRRVQLLSLLIGEPNVLLLDEPTNDLDIDTLTELEDLLDGWPGSLLVVSHDRYFLERVTDHVVALLGDGKLSFLGGGIDEYLTRRAGQQGGGAVPGLGVVRAQHAQPGDGTTTPLKSSGDVRMARKELQRLERQIAKLTGREAELHDACADHASDYGKLAELSEELKTVRAEKEELEERWLVVAEELPS